MPRMNRIGKHNTVVRSGSGCTEVVRVDRDWIVLDTGGYFTATTKTRMNQASNQFELGYYVYQRLQLNKVAVLVGILNRSLSAT